MNSNPINRFLQSAAGHRNVELRAEPLAAEREPGAALVRNHLTMIYPAHDLALVERSQRDGTSHPLGCLAIGVVENPDGIEGLKAGDLIFWNGPHADYGVLNPSGNIWAKVPEPDPRFLFAGVGAEGTAGLLDALGHEPHIPPHSIVIGQGMLGHLAAQWLRWRGSSVTVVENSPKRLEFSKYQGLTQKIDTHNLDWRKRVERWNPDGVDLIVDASAQARTLTEVMPFLRDGGKLCLLGQWRPDVSPVDLPLLVEEALKERTAMVYGPAPALGQSESHQGLLREWVELIQSETIPVKRLITNETPAEGAAMDVKRLATGVKSMLGVIIRWV